jgi:hypothetical protein
MTKLLILAATLALLVESAQARFHASRPALEQRRLALLWRQLIDERTAWDG